MALAARANLEALLRDRKLDHTLTTGAIAVANRDDLVPTGIGPLDRRLGGGLPRGQISEIIGPRSSGRTTVVFSTLAAATRRGELVAVVDALDMFDPASAATAGILLDRLLWIRGEAAHAAPAADVRGFDAGGRVSGRMEVTLDRAVKALNLVLQAGGFGLVVLDLADVPGPLVRRLPFTTWMRLQRVLEGSQTACVLLAPEPVARSAGGITLALARVLDGRRPTVARAKLSSAGGGAPRQAVLPIAGADQATEGAAVGDEPSVEKRSRLLAGLHIEARIIQARPAHDGPASFHTLPVGRAG